MILFRHADPRFPFLWESAWQPPARWHAEGEGPVQYLADTPDGAWAELLRHEGIVEEEDLLGIERDLWAIEVPTGKEPEQRPSLSPEVLHGGIDSYSECQAMARRFRQEGRPGLRAPSAALLPGGASGWYVEHGTLHAGSPREAAVIVLFGARSDLIGWLACARGRPGPSVLPKIRQLSSS